MYVLRRGGTFLQYLYPVADPELGRWDEAFVPMLERIESANLLLKVSRCIPV